jgi:hypothetical protein
MRVEHPSTTPTPGSEPVKSAQTRAAAAAARPSDADRVSLSADLRLLSAALRAVREPEPDIRPDAVARARTLIATGALTADLDSLAGRILEALVHEHGNDGR